VDPFLLKLAFLLLMGFGFAYFFLAGGRTFVREGDAVGASLAYVAFLFGGTLATLLIGLRAPLHPANAVVAALLFAAALALYEWARATIRERGFYVAWSGEVPETLCDAGPYRRLRHPIYASYMLAFAAQSIALPGMTTLAILGCAVALFVHAGWSDERSLARSDLAAEYAAYRRRAGMFLPRVWRGTA
jgi:protein-S-isoprenylcysteine O-methyltransferase Ste14